VNVGILAQQVMRKRAPGARLTACLVTLAVAGAGCMTSKVDETRQGASAIQPNESIVLLTKPQLEGVGTEGEFLSCVQQNLGGQLIHPQQGQSSKRASGDAVPFKIYGEQQFTDAMFPWFEPSTAPTNTAGLKGLLQRPGVTERLSEIGVRYVVWLDGATRRKDGGGSVSCSLGPTLVTCLGVGWWDKTSDYVATVWDLQTATEIGTVTADVTGTSVFIGAVAPIPIVMPVQSKACSRLSEQLRSFLVGSDLVAPAPAAVTGSGGN
jgi:hypothetical protein